MPKQRALGTGLVAAACLLGILNSGGYRYGASDQAFYLPAVIQHLDRTLFPRDRALLYAQDRFMLFDDLAAATAKVTQISIPTLFFALFLVGLITYFSGCLRLGRLWCQSWWGVAAFVLVMTLRHRISRTGVNTLEGYLHPRVLAFAAGTWALVAFMRGRSAGAVGLIIVAAALHTTTGLWFAIWIGVAIVVAERRWRRPLAVAVVPLCALGIGYLWVGPLREQMQRMDEQWLTVIASKDYLFAMEWPWSAWLVNLAYPVVIWVGYRMRAARGIAHSREQALVVGALSLVAVFAASLPFAMARLALAVQLQVTRVFWLLELLAALYLVWIATELHAVWLKPGTTGELARRSQVRPAGIALAVALASVSRGAYIMLVEQPDRRVVQIREPGDEWSDVMGWLRRTPTAAHVLADPDHAFLYGSSERVLGQRDLFLENSKDTALAIYSRPVAHRVLERIQAVGDFNRLTAETSRALAVRYDLDYLITERRMELPRAYANGRFNVYELKNSRQ